MSKTLLNGIELSVFSSRLEAVCEEMGAVLQRSAFSTNIKDRLDFSCAVFDVNGELSAQAAHIPVHLGSMAYAMKELVQQDGWADGDMLMVNDPFLGGTHLPDVTVIAPVFVKNELVAFVANRAHHASIGSDSPGSMPLSTHLEEEGVIIPPTFLIKKGEWQASAMDLIDESLEDGDFVAQVSANRIGKLRLEALIEPLSIQRYQQALLQLNDYGERMAMLVLKEIPAGEYAFSDFMDDDGAGTFDIVIKLTLKVGSKGIEADFGGTSSQVAGNINCPLSVAAAAVFYVFRCLMPAGTPGCAGVFRPIKLSAPVGSLVNAVRPAAVAAGNVETSTRITDVVLGALAQAIPERIPAASHGSMNNIAMGTMGDKPWDYYETIGGGMGASCLGDGQHVVQTHMTNTLNTPIESLEMHYPLRVNRYSVRTGSGGAGKHLGGDGLVREFEFLEDTTVTLLTERRRHAPWGLAGGELGYKGENKLNNRPVSPKCTLPLAAGDVLTVATPGGGGWGKKLG